MKIEDIVQVTFLTENRICKKIVPWGAIVLIVLSHFYIFAVVPSERVMGAVQRIFYFHVASAMASYLMVGVLLIASAYYLVTRKIEWDLLGEASAVVAFVFSSIVLASGMIWGHSAWNTWWRWEPRLVSFLVLWLILFSYVLLRSFTETHPKQRNFSAVLGVLAAVNVPVVIFSIKLLDQTQQLHPEVVAKQGLGDSRFVFGLILAIIAVAVLSLWLLIIRLTSGLLAERVRQLEMGR